MIYNQFLLSEVRSNEKYGSITKVFREKKIWQIGVPSERYQADS